MNPNGGSGLPPDFNLTAEQKALVERAVRLAVQVWTAGQPKDASEDHLRSFNPLIAILEWWRVNVPEEERASGAPETVLTDACRRFIAAQDTADR